MAFGVSACGNGPIGTGCPSEFFEDQVLGWIKNGQLQRRRRCQHCGITGVYLAAQLTIAQQFANWMQASYLPKGALGDVLQIRNAKLSPYNQNTAAHPNGYGALAKLYVQLMYGANKKIEPLTSDSVNWGIEANGFYGDSVDTISTPQRAYFTLPSFEQQGYGTELDQASDVSRHPRVEAVSDALRARQQDRGTSELVVLTKDRRHPFLTVTKGEYLHALEAAVLRKYAEETQKIARDNKGNQREHRLLHGLPEHEPREASWRFSTATGEKYRARLQEPAEIWTQETTVLLENYPDAFEGNGGTPTRLPVYTFDPRIVELSKTDALQWIVIYWTAHLNDPISLSLHEAMLNNFNFQYVYDYFFDFEKVKGQPYAPLRSPSLTETVVAGKPSAAATKNAADPALVFFEDFASSPVGKKPINWRSTLDNTGASSVVTELKGLDGRWAAMAGMQVAPTAMKTPLPRDFEVSYDVVAAQNYRWGAKGLTFKLSKTDAASFLSVKIRPGFDGRPGEVQIEGRFPGATGYMDGTKWVEAPGFSNNAVINRVTLTLKKKGDLLQVFVGQTKVAEYEKGVPPGIQFDALSFDLSGNSADERMFIGNIKIASN